jgi:hypothetical protein
MQTAIALSMGQPPPGQENGVTGAGGQFQQFGPATGEYHDTEKWAMTVSKATAREIVENPPPADRQRKPGQPAFLRASDRLGSESLAALLTIYHSIPLAREALLLSNYQQFNYGYDPQWWTGHHIEVPKIFSLDENGAHQNRDDILIETQRLMAFLDDTNRAYGSIDALTDLQSYHHKEAESELSRFLEAWADGAMIRTRDDPFTQVFSSHGIRNDPGSTMAKYFCSLEPMVDPEVNQTFTDILDNIIWTDWLSKAPLSDVWIDKVGHIMTFRLLDPKRKQGKLGVKIPAVWYPDRYMEHFREASRDMRARRKKILEELRSIECSKNEILNCPLAGRQGALDIKRVLSDAAERAPLVIKSQLQHGANATSNPPPPSSEVNDCVKALQDLVKSIDMKVAEFEDDKRQLRAELRATTEELTLPNDDPALSPYHRYTLRGVSTKPNITYVLHKASRDIQESDAESSASEQWQWWRISLSSNQANNEPAVMFGPQPRPSSEQGPSVEASGPYSTWPASNANNNHSSSQPNGNLIAYTVCKVSEEDVQTAAREEGDSVILVYASDKAVNFECGPLSGPLQMFVKADNKMFENELRGVEQSQGLDGVTNGEETAQLHFSSLDVMQDVPLIEDSDETMNSEKERASRTRSLPARRGADGQPSPKRAKGDGDPPPYHEHNGAVPEMQERSGGTGILGAVRPNRIGQHAEKMMSRVKDDTGSDAKKTSNLDRASSG